MRTAGATDGAEGHDGGGAAWLVSGVGGVSGSESATKPPTHPNGKVISPQDREAFWMLLREFRDKRGCQGFCKPADDGYKGCHCIREVRQVFPELGT